MTLGNVHAVWPCIFSASLDVTVTDKDDNAPVFEGGDSFIAEIPENRPQGTEITFVNTTALVINDIDSVSIVL